MKIGSAVNFRIETMAAHDEFALKQSNPTFIGLGSVGASQPQLFDTLSSVLRAMSIAIAQPPRRCVRYDV